MKELHNYWEISFIFRLLIILGLIGMPSSGWGQEQVNIREYQENCLSGSTLKPLFKLDGVELAVCTQFLPSEEFITTEPGSMIQSATMVDSSALYRNFAITAIPYGTNSPTENLPIAQPGSATEYRIQLRQYRQSQGGNPQTGLPITIFDQVIDASLSIVNLAIRPDHVTPVVIAEWVVEVGSRVWLVRISEELGEISAANIKIDQLTTLLNQTSIRSTNLNAPSTLLATQAQLQSSSIDQDNEESQPFDLPTPSWWKGECNRDNHVGSFPLGGSYRGVKACGPKNSFVIVDFGVGAKQREWQCTEYSKRFMLLAYGVAPYVADGKDVVNNFPTNKYPALKVEKVANGAVGKAPRPGDILSYGINTTNGHTSVVSESNVDSNGNGSVKVIEQNLSLNGISNLTVKNWKVNRDVNSWLRFNSDGSSNPTPPRSCPGPNLKEPSHGSIFDNRTISFRWAGIDCPHDGYTFRIKTVSDMDSGGETVIDTGEGNTERTVTIDEKWENRDLYWSVKAANAPGGASWAPVRQFRVSTNKRPNISFNAANGNNADTINSRDQTWTFTGTADDPEGRLNRVEFKCEGDSCNATQNIGNNGNWSFQRGGLTGRNRIWFTACDDRQCVDSRVVTLRIDLAPPVTTADANGQSNPSGWFRGPVEVKLRAQDGATGSAAVGVREIRYRIDNGDWQSSSGDSKSLTINTDGAHTVEYYAVDHLDNQESPAKRIAFQIDATPPSAPGAATETHGVGNDQWQKSVGAPEFTWGPASDSTSGLQHYELYFGPDANSDQIQSFVAANADRRWTPLPNGVRTGVYYLRARARDIAGNYSAWSTLFTFRYDVTPPGNPTAATHAANLPSGSWQRTSATADFTWTPPSDEGSGVKGYYIYWGDQPEGKDESPGAFRTNAAYVATGPLCVAGQSCTGYLRVRSVDYVDNFAGDWSTLYTLRYDGAAPTLDFTINGGVTQTAQTLVSLNLNATDQGSGVRDARSFAGNGWSPWEAYQTERIETIPAIGRQSWPVYVQVRDAVGWESTVISKSVYFEVNRPQPKSANFWLFMGMFNGGNGSHTSANYQGRSSVGQSVDAAPITSPNYILRGGYQAASQALPLQVPDHDEFTLINGIFASGIVNGTMQSAQYRLASSIGQMGLPANQTTISSAGYQLQPGFLAAVPAQQTTPTPPPTPTPGPTPTPEPPSGCEFATLSINNGALFTNNSNVTLNLCGPQAVEMKVSNDGSFANAPWEPYRTSKGWTLATLGQNVIARLVQARFKDSAGLTHHYAVDDIIYDPTAPSGALAVNDPVPAALLAQGLATNVVQAASSLSTAAMESFTIGDMTYVSRLGNRLFPRPVPLLAPRNEGGLDVYLIAQDDNSGLAQMQLSENADGDGATWQDYDGLVQWTPSGGDGEKQLYARFLDSAGNASSVYSATVVIDSQPPLGGVNIIQEIIGTNTVSLQLYLAAEDNLSSIPAIRLSHDPTFADAPWQPFIAEINWPIQVNANENEKTIYVQFRDAAGNVSQTYSDTVLIDRQPPVMYVEVATGDSLTRQVNLYAYDELSALTTMRLSNDPLLLDAVVTLPYSDTVAWTFDERRVVWVQVDDGAGNRSDPYPAYAAMPGDTPDPEPVDQRVYLPLINR